MPGKTPSQVPSRMGSALLDAVVFCVPRSGGLRSLLPTKHEAGRKRRTTTQPVSKEKKVPMVMGKMVIVGGTGRRKDRKPKAIKVVNMKHRMTMPILFKAQPASSFKGK